MEKEHLKLQKNHNIKTKQQLDTIFIDNKGQDKKKEQVNSETKQKLGQENGERRDSLGRQ